MADDYTPEQLIPKNKTDNPKIEIFSIEDAPLSKDSHEALNYFSLKNCGLFLQYFFVGIVYTTTIGMNYEFFRNYLGQNGDMYNIAGAAISFPWALKFLFGILHDTTPIFGRHRKPYMIIGWVLCALTGLILTVIPLPPPRYQYPERALTGENCRVSADERVFREGTTDTEYTKWALLYIALLMVFNICLVCADVAMDGLMVEYARRECLSKRGRMQTYIYSTRHVGIILGSIIRAFGLNWYKYAGPWCHGLTVSHLFGMLSFTSCLAILSVAFMTTEERKDERQVATPGEVRKIAWKIIQSRAVQQVAFFSWITGFLESLQSPADSMIMNIWVKADSLAKNLIGNILGNTFFLIGTVIFGTFLVNRNWKKIYASTIIIVVLWNASLTYITVYDVIRNQYFYFADEVGANLFVGVNFISTLLLVVELSEDKTEGLTYGLLTSITNISLGVGALVSNLIALPFKVSSEKRFLCDQASDRNIVAIQTTIMYLLTLCSLLFLPLLPANKKETQILKATKGSSKIGGLIFITAFIVCSIYSIAFSFTWPFVSIAFQRNENITDC